MLLFGLVVFAVLVGIITDSVTSLMAAIEDGRTRVAEKVTRAHCSFEPIMHRPEPASLSAPPARTTP